VKKLNNNYSFNLKYNYFINNHIVSLTVIILKDISLHRKYIYNKKKISFILSFYFFRGLKNLLLFVSVRDK
jgi:hypothetical protein